MKHKKTAVAAREVEAANDITDLAEVQIRVDSILENYLRERTKRAKLMAPRYGELWQASADTILGGGKRIRPYLMVLAYESYGTKKADEPVMRAAVGLEMLHQAMLMHDDVIDRDYVRHGKPNVAGVFRQSYNGTDGLSEEDKLHLSHSAGILAGDLALAGAYELVRTSGLKDSDITMLHEMLDEAVFTVVGGELLDSEAVGEAILETDVQSIAGFKTASYSFIVPLISGAKLAGANESDMAALRNLGWELGIAFQLTDDLLGAFGEVSKTGKSTTSDFEEGKHTFLIQNAFMNGDAKAKHTLEKLLGKKGMTAKEKGIIRDILVQTGAKQACETLIAKHAAAAKTVMKDMPCSHEGKDAFEVVIHMSTRRDK